jgi:hypothetical protein
LWDDLFIAGEIAMRSAAFLFCLITLADVASAQQTVFRPTPPAEPYSRPSIFVGPSYRNTGKTFYSGPDAVDAFRMTRSSQVGNVVPRRSMAPVTTGNTWHHATYFRNPYYPSLNFAAPTDIRPQEYVIPPVTRTPLHDPYFEERVYEEFDDAYEYWGW